MTLKRLHSRMEKAEPMQRCNFPDCKAACCVYGAWVDKYQADEIIENAPLILPHMPETVQQPELWFDRSEEDDRFALSGKVIHTTLLPDEDHYGGMACIFMREDYKCALQVASEFNGFDYWHFKPFYCILHPLDLDEDGLITLDETEAVVNESGSCLRAADKKIPLRETFAEELNYLIRNPKGYS